jgi:UDP-N-acetylmuramoyl-L-alanyl-D-glutamate--2,6-diaminopimelate ligase
LVLTDEDPRLEDPVAILEEIADGVGNRDDNTVRLVPDRRRAIRLALEIARPGDAVLFLGKGHESSIIYADGPVPWDEETEVRAALAEMGYSNG